MLVVFDAIALVAQYTFSILFLRPDGKLFQNSTLDVLDELHLDVYPKVWVEVMWIVVMVYQAVWTRGSISSITNTSTTPSAWVCYCARCSC